MPRRKKTAADINRTDLINLILQQAECAMHIKQIQAALHTQDRITHELATLVQAGHVIHLGLDGKGLTRYIHVNTGKNAPQRTCTKCGQSKPATKDFFHAKDKHAGTFQAICKVCRLDTLRARRDTASRQRKSEVATPPGRIHTEPGQVGRVVRFGKDWKPYRDQDARRRSPSMLGYASPLCRA